MGSRGSQKRNNRRGSSAPGKKSTSQIPPAGLGTILSVLITLYGPSEQSNKLLFLLLPAITGVTLFIWKLVKNHYIDPAAENLETEREYQQIQKKIKKTEQNITSLRARRKEAEEDPKTSPETKQHLQENLEQLLKLQSELTVEQVHRMWKR